MREWGTREAENLQVVTDRGDYSRRRQTQLGQRPAADAADRTAGMLILLAHPCFQFLSQVIAWQ